VDVVSLDWKWLFIYPDLGIAAVNQLAAGGNADSLSPDGGDSHEFVFRAAARQPIYTMAGMTTHLNLMALRQANFPASPRISRRWICRNAVHVDAMPPNDFDGWVTKAKASAVVLDDEGYAALAKRALQSRPRPSGRSIPNFSSAYST